jgi:2,5-diketo-D-gluconate reductase B
MIYQTIQGEEVPALGFGTFGLEGNTGREAVAHALELGYRHIDTAESYYNEEAVGAGLQQAGVPRDEIFLTTKVGYDKLAPKAVRRSAEESLRKLQTDYVDLLLVHWPNDNIPLEETLDAFAILREEDKTRHIGVSNFTPSLLQRALDHADLFCNQVEYHPFLGQDDLLTLCRQHDLLLTAYSPIAQGEVMDNETLQTIGERHGKSPTQVTLRWLVQQNNVAAIPRTSSAEHRASNFDIFDFSLSDDEMDRIATLAQGKRLVDPEIAPAW